MGSPAGVGVASAGGAGSFAGVLDELADGGLVVSARMRRFCMATGRRAGHLAAKRRACIFFFGWMGWRTAELTSEYKGKGRDLPHLDLG